MRYLVNKLPCEGQLPHFRQRMGAGIVEQRNLVRVIRQRVLRAICDQKRDLFAPALFFGLLHHIVAFCRKTDAVRSVLARRNGRENINGRLQDKGKGFARLFHLAIVRDLRGVVRDRRDANENVGAIDSA